MYRLWTLTEAVPCDLEWLVPRVPPGWARAAPHGFKPQCLAYSRCSINGGRTELCAVMVHGYTCQCWEGTRQVGCRGPGWRKPGQGRLCQEQVGACTSLSLQRPPRWSPAMAQAGLWLESVWGAGSGPGFSHPLCRGFMTTLSDNAKQYH